MVRSSAPANANNRLSADYLEKLTEACVDDLLERIVHIGLEMTADDHAFGELVLEPREEIDKTIHETNTGLIPQMAMDPRTEKEFRATKGRYEAALKKLGMEL